MAENINGAEREFTLSMDDLHTQPYYSVSYNVENLSLLDYFAGQFIVRGDTAHDAYRNAQLMMKEREKYV